MAYLSNYKIALLTSITTGTGTMDVSGVNITGHSSAFLTELNVGDVLVDPIAGEAHAVATITSNTVATVNTAFVEIASGLTVKFTTLVNIESFAKQLAPKGSFQPYAEALNLGNSRLRGGGLPTDTWHWGFMPKASRESLRAYCTGASAEVFMRTRVIDGTAADGEDKFQTFDAIMLWPLNESADRPLGTRVPFSIQWRAMVLL
jgi:hypothetical protein